MLRSLLFFNVVALGKNPGFLCSRLHKHSPVSDCLVVRATSRSGGACAPATGSKAVCLGPGCITCFHLVTAWPFGYVPFFVKRLPTSLLRLHALCCRWRSPSCGQVREDGVAVKGCKHVRFSVCVAACSNFNCIGGRIRCLVCSTAVPEVCLLETTSLLPCLPWTSFKKKERAVFSNSATCMVAGLGRVMLT